MNLLSVAAIIVTIASGLGLALSRNALARRLRWPLADAITFAAGLVLACAIGAAICWLKA